MYKRKKNLRFDQLHYNNDTEEVMWLTYYTVLCRTSKIKQCSCVADDTICGVHCHGTWEVGGGGVMPPDG